MMMNIFEQQFINIGCLECLQITYISRKSSLSQADTFDCRVISYWNSLIGKTQNLELSLLLLSDLLILFSFAFRTGESSYRACFSFHSSYSEVRGSHIPITYCWLWASLVSGGIFSTAEDSLWLFLDTQGKYLSGWATFIKYKRICYYLFSA